MAQVPVGRVATSTHLDLIMGSLRRLQTGIARSEAELSSGLRVAVPSDDPLAAVRSLRHQSRLDRTGQYLRNISLQSGEMAATDGALDALGKIASEAKQILLSQIGDTATAETRRNSASQVQALLEE